MINFSCCAFPHKRSAQLTTITKGDSVNNTNQKNGITPPHEDKTHNANQANALSPNLYKHVFEALFPYHRGVARMDIMLTDDHDLLLDAVIGQIELLHDLGSKISGNEDIAGFGLVGFSDSLSRQLKVLGVINDEYCFQVGLIRDRLENTVEEQALKITQLEGQVLALRKEAVEREIEQRSSPNRGTV